MTPSYEDIAYVVEATSCERHLFWCIYSEECRRQGWHSPYIAVSWNDFSTGNMVDVATLTINRKKNPVTVCLNYATIDGIIVVFYEATSQVVDHRLVKEWLEKNIPAYSKRQYCYAEDFHTCLAWIKRNNSIPGDNL